MTDALVILRTPLQAHLARQVLSREGINEYDLIYITQNDSQEDRNYFSRLSGGAKFHCYTHNRPKQFDFLNHATFRYLIRHCFKDFGRRYVIIGSIDAPVISALVRCQQKSSLITVDDGTANISRLSIYRDPKRSLRYKMYAHLLRAYPITQICDRIERHYTLFRGVDNIVDENRLRYLPAICPGYSREPREGSRTYFIGQPVPLKYGDAMTKAIKKVLGNRIIDRYVRHPREERPLELDAPFLNKDGLIAEEAIIRDAGGRDVNIVSGFSTATINLAPFVMSAEIVIPSTTDKNVALEMERVAKLAGCKVRHEVATN